MQSIENWGIIIIKHISDRSTLTELIVVKLHYMYEVCKDFRGGGGGT